MPSKADPVGPLRTLRTRHRACTQFAARPDPLARAARGPGVLTLGVLMLGVVLAAGVANAQDAANAQERPAYLDRILERQLLDASNDARRAHGLPAFRFDEGLARAARAHAAENAERGLLSHGSPDPARATAAMRVAAAGVALIEVGENLARIPGADVAENSVDGWLASPPHRRNLLNESFTHVGFGTALGPHGTYVAQVFGARPLAREEARAVPRFEATIDWTIRIEGDAGAEAMAFLDARPVEPLRLDANGVVTLRLFVDEDTTPRLDLGVPSGASTYLRSDAVVLDPAGWTRVEAHVPGEVRVAEAHGTPRTRGLVRLELRYAPTGAPLALYTDGEHRPDAQIDGGTVRLEVPADAVPSELAVAILDAPGRARLIERFTVVPGDPPELVPGRPPIRLEDAP